MEIVLYQIFYLKWMHYWNIEIAFVTTYICTSLLKFMNRITLHLWRKSISEPIIIDSFCTTYHVFWNTICESQIHFTNYATFCNSFCVLWNIIHNSKVNFMVSNDLTLTYIFWKTCEKISYKLLNSLVLREKRNSLYFCLFQ